VIGRLAPLGPELPENWANARSIRQFVAFGTRMIETSPSNTLVKACCIRACRWASVPIHHLYPLVGSVAVLGKTVPPMVEIDCMRLTASAW
jgi:hypothetical protein